MLMSDKEFQKLSSFIQNELGIKMPLSKKAMLESRLQKRLRLLGLGSYDEYCDFVFGPGGESELMLMMDLVTTNKTDFFREPNHFDFLYKTALPELVRNSGAGVKRKLMAWSAGCSTGEEPYTIAMVMSEFARSFPGLGFDFTILATDISTRVVNAASKGIYGNERIGPISEEMRKKYLLRSKDPSKKLFRIATELREKVRFRRLNFMDADFGFREPLDIIFCRNVIIYFDKETQNKLLERFCYTLQPGSYLFLGHSETLNGSSLPLEKVAASVYRRVE